MPYNDADYKAAKNTVKGITGLIDFVNDKLLQMLVERELSDMDVVASKTLAQNHTGGVLVFVSFYKGAESSQRYFNGVEYLADGLNPNAAYQTSRRTGGVSRTPPDGMLPDDERSFMIWYTLLGSSLQRNYIAWPFWQLVVKQQYPG